MPSQDKSAPLKRLEYTLFIVYKMADSVESIRVTNLQKSLDRAMTNLVEGSKYDYGIVFSYIH